MHYGADVAYLYDGSFEGLLCCVFESFQKKECPIMISTNKSEQQALCPAKEIFTDNSRAARVAEGIKSKISPAAFSLVRRAHFTCLPQKELAILNFLLLGFKVGANITLMLSHERVNVLMKAVKHLDREAHLLKGFIRFSEYGGVLAAVIEPKNRVLPFLAAHFCSRFSGESFMIYDKTNKEVLLYGKGCAKIATADAPELPPAEESELFCRELWRRYYDTIAIEARYNPKCRQSHMPKRYWGNMTELSNN